MYFNKKFENWLISDSYYFVVHTPILQHNWLVFSLVLNFQMNFATPCGKNQLHVAKIKIN